MKEHKTRKTSTTSLTLAKKIAEFASEKKAEDIIVMDMRDIVNFCDFFVICSGNSDRQVGAIADFIDEQLFLLGYQVHSRKGAKNTSWIVFDSGDIVIHIFHKDVREFYKLEYLWQEAKQVAWEKKKRK